MAGIFEDREPKYDYSGLGDGPRDTRIFEIASSFGNWDRRTDRRLKRLNRQEDRRERRDLRQEESSRVGLRGLLDAKADEFLDERMYNPEEDYEYQGSPEYIEEHGSFLDKLALLLNR